ncbi:MAG TPA: hypothetical protein VFX02_05180 [Gammaproteobacteria bacterium]|nr:hypothetical protein [Gammaproteobacteria bacterium]
MFSLHNAFALQLLTLVAAAALLAWSGYSQVHARKLVRGIAYVAIVVSTLSLLCAAYYGLKYSRAGYFNAPAGRHHMMENGMMMQKGMMDGNMMEGMQKDPADGRLPAPETEDEHSHDHGE